FAAAVPNTHLDTLRVLLATAALIAGGAAVARSPRDPKLLGLAALTALLCRFGFPAHWDSGRMASRLLTIIAASAALLLVLPAAAPEVAAAGLAPGVYQLPAPVPLRWFFAGGDAPLAPARGGRLRLAFPLPAVLAVSVPAQRLPLLPARAGAGEPVVVLRPL